MRGGSRGASSRSASGVVGPLLLVLAVALATFIRALGNGFVWDDKVILSKQLSAFPTLAQVFFPPANIPQYSPFYYRPMVVLTYLVDGTLGGGSPLPFHATPILLHALAACLALLLFLRLLGPNATAAATVGALAFAVHPAHTEVAAWMAGRGDAIATVGVLVALLAWGRWLETPGWGWLAAGAGGLDADHAARGLQPRERRGDARDQPAAADRHDHRVERRHVVGELEPDAGQLDQPDELEPVDGAGGELFRALASASQNSGHYREAVDAWRRARVLDPGDLDAGRQLAFLLATCPDASLRDGAEALALAQPITLARPDDIAALDALAAAQAELGRFDAAVATIRRALEAAERQDKAALAPSLRQRAATYAGRRPYRPAR